jgi:hypothetical protein
MKMMYKYVVGQICEVTLAPKFSGSAGIAFNESCKKRRGGPDLVKVVGRRRTSNNHGEADPEYSLEPYPLPLDHPQNYSRTLYEKFLLPVDNKMIELINVPAGCTRIWEVWVNADSVEGRGPLRLHARFNSEADAVSEAQGKGPMGASNAEIRQAIVFDSRASFHQCKDLELKQQALRKLSSEERRVLGL